MQIQKLLSENADFNTKIYSNQAMHNKTVPPSEPDDPSCFDCSPPQSELFSDAN